jgi:peptide/nickel transport system permease protein
VAGTATDAGPSVIEQSVGGPTWRQRMAPRIAQMRRTWYFLRRNNLAMAGLIILILIGAMAVYALTTNLSYTAMTQVCATNGVAADCAASAQSVCTYSPGTTSPGPGCYQTPAGFPSVIAPTWASITKPGPLPLGSLTVDPPVQYFYNTYDGLLRGSDWSLLISLSIVGAGATIGLFLGAISGYMGGVVDEGLMRLVDIFLSIPQLLFVIVVVTVLITLLPSSGAAFADHIYLLIAAFLVTWWPFYARIVRGQVLVVREQKYVEAARASGASRGRIIARHIVPNSVYPVFIQMSLDVGTIPIIIGTIVFLGIRIFPSTYLPEWGTIAALSVTGLTSFWNSCQLGVCVIPWWQLLFPGLALFLFAISVNFLADGLRDALDPRLRR